MTFSLDDLRRWPDLETNELRAWDAADTLILDDARPHLDGAAVTVMGDAYGALTLGAIDAGARAVRVHQDPLAGEIALAANAEAAFGVGAAFESLPLDASLVSGATLVLLRLPRSLEALADAAALIAEHADPTVIVIAGGRLKHMSLGMNEVLARHFGQVDVSLARQKSRLLTAREPLAGSPVEPTRRWHDELGLWVIATGGVFAGTGIDIGTRALIAALDDVPDFERAVDLGCGTGILAALLARAHPGASVLATDQSAAAVASARLTMQANELDVAVTRDDALAQVDDASVDLVVLNPPFHTGAAVHAGVATKLFEAAARVLRPGGELWTVYNSHLAYRPQLERLIGESRQISRGPKFTVLASTRR